MLDFFRKHQRYFFIGITIMIVISFAFFGTSNSMLGKAEKVPDKIIGKAINGSSIMHHEVAALSRFLDARSTGNSNLLDDGVILRDFLKSGFAEQLADAYFEELKPDLETRFEKIRAYRPYQHPQAPYLSAEAVWQRFLPQMSEQIAVAKQKSKQIDKNSFSMLANLYLTETQFPPGMMARILGFQQTQYKLQPDPMLKENHLTLFGFQHVEDWFGPRFVEIASQFLINASAYAEQKGHKISREEAKASLLKNLSLALQQSNPKEALTVQDLNGALREQLYLLGLDERSAVDIWRKVLLFRSLLDEAGKGAVLDPIVQKEFFAGAGDALVVDQYELPDALRFRNFRDMLKLQLYLDSVAPNSYKSKGFCLKLPSQFLSIAELEKQAPELVRRRFVVELAKVKKEHLAQNISLKETWDWELAENNWSDLKKSFPALAKAQGVKREERFAVLEALPAETRFEVDRFARNRMVDAHGQWIDEALEKATLEKQTVSIALKGDSAPFEGIEDPEALIAELDRAREINRYSGDGNTFYRIRVLESVSEKELIPFAEANQKGILAAILDKNLEEAYSDARKKEPKAYQHADGTWKSFSEVKDLVGAYVYAPLLKFLQQQITAENPKKEKASLEEYAQVRLFSHLKDVKDQLVADPENTFWIQTPVSEIAKEGALLPVSLGEQWKLTKTRVTLKKADSPVPEMISQPVGSWSPIAFSREGTACFCRLFEKTVLESAKKEAIDKAQERLASEARLTLMKTLIDEVQKKGAIAVIKKND